MSLYIYIYTIYYPYTIIHYDHSKLRDKTDTELLAIGVVCSNALIGRAVKPRPHGVSYGALDTVDERERASIQYYSIKIAAMGI